MTMLGTIYGFSIFLAPWEELLGATRSDVSSILSVSTISATAGIFIGYRLYPLLSPPIFAAAVCVVSAAGVLLSGWGMSLLPLWIGYGLLFGGANGIGYGFTIQIASQAMPERKGFAIGVIAAAYAGGSGLAPLLLSEAIEANGISTAMDLLAAAFIGTGVLVAGLLKFSQATFEAEPKASTDDDSPQKGSNLIEAVLWLGYGAGAAAGVMAIGHSAGIVTAAGGNVASTGPALNATGYLLGGLAAGWLSDRFSVRTLLSALPLLSAVVLLMLAQGGTISYVLGCLALIGFGYGALVVVYPIAVAHYFGILSAGRIYGRVCISWGFAGFLAPWFAGYLFDQTGGYGTALTVAAGTAVASALAVRLLPKDAPAHVMATASETPP
jgi:MFS transporter, OFA family, oxalate/formate antiporter